MQERTGASAAPVAVWWLPLRLARRINRARVVPLLTDGELSRVAGFRDADDASRFVAGHLLLRFATAEALGCTVPDVVLEQHCADCGRSDHGRPTVSGRPGAPYLSLTHGGDVIAVACGWAPVGIDAEPYGPDDLAATARRVFTVRERTACATATQAGRGVRLGYDLWALKEAFVKGAGPSAGLGKLRRLDMVAAVERPAWVSSGRTRLRCQRIALAPGHAAAVATAGGVPSVYEAAGAVQALYANSDHGCRRR